MKCSKCGLDVPSSYLKCPSCGQGFHGVNSPSSFNSAPATQASQKKSSGQSIGIQTVGTPSSHSGVDIGGWLILPALFLPIGIFYRLAIFIDGFKPFFTPGVFSEVFTFGSSTYHPMNFVVIGYELIYNIFIFLFAIRVAYLFYKKSASLPKLYIYLLLFILIGSVVDLILASQLPTTKIDDKVIKDVFGLLLSVIVWGIYFSKSKRVKQTFVN